MKKLFLVLTVVSLFTLSSFMGCTGDKKKTSSDTADSTLSSLTIIGFGLNETFESSVTDYTATVNVSEITIMAVTSDESASFEIYKGNSQEADNIITLDSGANNIDIIVTAVDNSKQTYSIVVTRTNDSNLPNDTRLSSLSVEGHTINETFSSFISSYTLTVSAGSVTMNAIPNSSKSSVALSNNGSDVTGTTVVLTEGENEIEIKVTAENGSHQVYTLTVTRVAEPAADSDATLADLSITGHGLNETFSRWNTSYTATVSEADITIYALQNNSNSTIAIYKDSVLDDTSISSLIIGDNTIEVKVTAQDSTEKTYTITVTRIAEPDASNDATLSQLSISGQELNETFSKWKSSYSANVDVNNLTIIAVTYRTGASYKVYLNDIEQPGSSISINDGTNKLEIRVIAEDGSTTMSYFVTATKSASPGGISVTITSPTENQTLSGIVTISGTYAGDVSVIEVYVDEIDFSEGPGQGPGEGPGEYPEYPIEEKSRLKRKIKKYTKEADISDGQWSFDGIDLSSLYDGMHKIKVIAYNDSHETKDTVFITTTGGKSDGQPISGQISLSSGTTGSISESTPLIIYSSSYKSPVASGVRVTSGTLPYNYTLANTEIGDEYIVTAFIDKNNNGDQDEGDIIGYSSPFSHNSGPTTGIDIEIEGWITVALTSHTYLQEIEGNSTISGIYFGNPGSIKVYISTEIGGDSSDADAVINSSVAVLDAILSAGSWSVSLDPAAIENGIYSIIAVALYKNDTLANFDYVFVDITGGVERTPGSDISGTISLAPFFTGHVVSVNKPLFIKALNTSDNSQLIHGPVTSGNLTSGIPYTIENLTAGTWILQAFVDNNKNGLDDEDLSTTKPYSATVTGVNGEDVSDINISLIYYGVTNSNITGAENSNSLWNIWRADDYYSSYFWSTFTWDYLDIEYEETYSVDVVLYFDEYAVYFFEKYSDEPVYSILNILDYSYNAGDVEGPELESGSFIKSGDGNSAVFAYYDTAYSEWIYLKLSKRNNFDELVGSYADYMAESAENSSEGSSTEQQCELKNVSITNTGTQIITAVEFELDASISDLTSDHLFIDATYYSPTTLANPKTFNRYRGQRFVISDFTFTYSAPNWTGTSTIDINNSSEAGVWKLGYIKVTSVVETPGVIISTEIGHFSSVRSGTLLQNYQAADTATNVSVGQVDLVTDVSEDISGPILENMSISSGTGDLGMDELVVGVSNTGTSGHFNDSSLTNYESQATFYKDGGSEMSEGMIFAILEYDDTTDDIDYYRGDIDSDYSEAGSYTLKEITLLDGIGNPSVYFVYDDIDIYDPIVNLGFFDPGDFYCLYKYGEKSEISTVSAVTYTVQ